MRFGADFRVLTARVRCRSPGYARRSVRLGAPALAGGRQGAAPANTQVQ
jgi:hypothetical protein